MYTRLSVCLFVSFSRAHCGFGVGCTFQEKQESLCRFFVESLIGFAQQPVAPEHRSREAAALVRSFWSGHLQLFSSGHSARWDCGVFLLLGRASWTISSAVSAEVRGASDTCSLVTLLGHLPIAITPALTTLGTHQFRTLTVAIQICWQLLNWHLIA